MEAESAQRGFLLTGEEKYLPPLETGLAATQGGGGGGFSASCTLRYQQLDPSQLKVLDGVTEDLKVKAGEMRQSVALLKAGKPHEALALVKTDLGLYQTFAIIKALEAMRANEREQVSQGLDTLEKSIQHNTLINTGNLVFTIAILLLAGLLVTRDIRRRNNFAAQLAMQIGLPHGRTAGSEPAHEPRRRGEKHALARELHDELGGLLVAMRMDIAQIRKRLGPAAADAELLTRWERVEQALSQGLELKRRVIEDLRPTLLDNMGLFTALRWLATERSEQAQLTLHMEGLEEDIDLPPETAIAVFRTAQEAVANVVKHARATQLMVKAEVGTTPDAGNPGRWSRRARGLGQQDRLAWPETDALPDGSGGRHADHRVAQPDRHADPAVRAAGTAGNATGLVPRGADIRHDLRQPLEVLFLVQEVLDTQLPGTFAILRQRVVRPSRWSRAGSIRSIRVRRSQCRSSAAGSSIQQVHRQLAQRADGRGSSATVASTPHSATLRQQFAQAFGDARGILDQQHTQVLRKGLHSPSVHQPVAQRVRSDVGVRLEAHLLEHARAIGADRLHAQRQLVRDLGNWTAPRPACRRSGTRVPTARHAAAGHGRYPVRRPAAPPASG